MMISSKNPEDSWPLYRNASEAEISWVAYTQALLNKRPLIQVPKRQF